MHFRDLFSHVKSISVDEAQRLIEERQPGSYTLVDVREPAEYEAGHIPGALFIPLSDLPDRLEEIDSSKPVFAY